MRSRRPECLLDDPEGRGSSTLRSMRKSSMKILHHRAKCGQEKKDARIND